MRRTFWRCYLRALQARGSTIPKSTSCLLKRALAFRNMRPWIGRATLPISLWVWKKASTRWRHCIRSKLTAITFCPHPQLLQGYLPPCPRHPLSADKGLCHRTGVVLRIVSLSRCRLRRLRSVHHLGRRSPLPPLSSLLALHLRRRPQFSPRSPWLFCLRLSPPPSPCYNLHHGRRPDWRSARYIRCRPLKLL
jgi:hypothetical protein